VSGTVWKFSLDGVTNTIDIPKGAKPLSVAQQHNRLVLWAQVDPDALTEERTFYVVGTGTPIPDEVGPFIGTAVCDGGMFVFHIFDDPAVTS
jgi:hypothetical protein